MIRKRLRDDPRLALLERLDLLEERYKRLRIVARTIHVLDAQKIRLGLELARKMQERHRHRDRRCLIQLVARHPAQKDQRHRPDLRVVHPRHLARRVVRRHVGNLVRHHPGQFRLFVRVQDQARIHIKKSPRQRKRVDLVRIDHLDGERNLRVRVLHNVLTDPVHILGHHRVCDELRALVDLRRVLVTHADLPVGRVPVAEPAPADVAVAHRIHVFNTARLRLHNVAARLDQLDRLVGRSHLRVFFCLRVILLRVLAAVLGRQRWRRGRLLLPRARGRGCRRLAGCRCRPRHLSALPQRRRAQRHTATGHKANQSETLLLEVLLLHPLGHLGSLPAATPATPHTLMTIVCAQLHPFVEAIFHPATISPTHSTPSPSPCRNLLPLSSLFHWFPPPTALK